MLPDGRDRVRHNRRARSTAPHPVFRTWRRKRVIKRATIDEALWNRVVAQLPFLAGLPADDARRLRELAVLFLHEKEIAAAGGLELTDAIRLAIALQACLPILNLGLDFYDGWVGVVVYPGEFRVRRQELDDDGVMHEWDDELSGEAWPGGPVALSWEDVELGAAPAAAGGEPGYNVVIHEFAHKIDMLKGEADGFPLPHADMDAGVWQRTLESAYARFVRHGRPRAGNAARSLWRRAPGRVLRGDERGLLYRSARPAGGVPGRLRAAQALLSPGSGRAAPAAGLTVAVSPPAGSRGRSRSGPVA